MSFDAQAHDVWKSHHSRNRRRACRGRSDSCRHAGARACSAALRLLDLDRGRIVLQVRWIGLRPAGGLREARRLSAMSGPREKILEALARPANRHYTFARRSR